MWLLGITAIAWAGPVIGVSGGLAKPLGSGAFLDRGVSLGAVVGYRAAVGVVHVRPDLTVRVNGPADTLTAAVGGAVTVGGPVAAGGYAHLGIGTNFDHRFPHGDAGAIVELGVGPLLVAATLGWERMVPQALEPECPAGSGGPPCEIPLTDDWLVPGLMLALHL